LAAARATLVRSEIISRSCWYTTVSRITIDASPTRGLDRVRHYRKLPLCRSGTLFRAILSATARSTAGSYELGVPARLPSQLHNVFCTRINRVTLNLTGPEAKHQNDFRSTGFRKPSRPL
jgi:hypothetical protein